MKSIRLLIISLTILGINSCRKKEVFPDLAKQLEGTYTITEAVVAYTKPSRTTITYNPKDSAQTGQVTVKKIDALSANVYVLLKRRNGEIIFEDTFYSELSRDISNKGWINFTAAPSNRGATYIVDDARKGNNYISLVGYSTYQNRKSEVGGSFIGRR